MNTFKCEVCKETFCNGWTDKEADEEYQTAPWNIPGDTAKSICDDCFKDFQIWFDRLNEEDHKRIRKQ